MALEDQLRAGTASAAQLADLRRRVEALEQTAQAPAPDTAAIQNLYTINEAGEVEVNPEAIGPEGPEGKEGKEGKQGKEGPEGGTAIGPFVKAITYEFVDLTAWAKAAGTQYQVLVPIAFQPTHAMLVAIASSTGGVTTIEPVSEAFFSGIALGKAGSITGSAASRPAITTFLNQTLIPPCDGPRMLRLQRVAESNNNYEVKLRLVLFSIDGTLNFGITGNTRKEEGKLLTDNNESAIGLGTLFKVSTYSRTSANLPTAYTGGAGVRIYDAEVQAGGVACTGGAQMWFPTLAEREAAAAAKKLTWAFTNAVADTDGSRFVNFSQPGLN